MDIAKPKKFKKDNDSARLIPSVAQYGLNVGTNNILIGDFVTNDFPEESYRLKIRTDNVIFNAVMTEHEYETIIHVIQGIKDVHGITR